ncbi:MAG: M28 family peptidase [Gemmatimonadetes bacterium]|nr:M28 family peptidase [Gemmatimonadota bacterium]
MFPSIRGLTIALTGAWLGTSAAALAAQTPTPVDSVRLLRNLSILAHDSMEGRAPGTAGSQRARSFLEREVAATGASAGPGGFARAFTWADGDGVNLVGIVPGRGASSDVVVLTAHYDHLGVRDGQIFNGTDDNASGAAALIEITRQVVARPLQHTLVVALLDAEERGSRGARALVASPPVPLERMAVNVNLDMVARTDGVLWAGGAYHTPGLRPILERVAAEAPLTLRLGHDRPGAPEGDDWTNQSDHGVFHALGIPFVYFGVEDHPDYHRPTDDFERVDPGEYVASVRTILLGLRALDAALPLGSP